MRLLRGRPPNVERLERGGKAAGLLRALSYEDSVTDTDGRTVDLGTDTRIAATMALARLDSPLAIEGLLQALRDPEEVVRVTAVRGLKDRGGPGAIEPLIRVAVEWSDSERALSRSVAIDALAGMRDRRVALEVVSEMLTRAAEPDDADRAAAARITRAGGDEAVRVVVADLIAHLAEASAPTRARTLLVALAPESVEPLIDSLRDPRSRHDAALALGSTHASAAVPELGSLMLSDPDPQTRRAAAWALGEIRDPAAVEVLLLATRDEEYGVRSEAIDSFDKLGNAAVALAVSSLMGPVLGAGEQREPELTAAANGTAEAAAPQMEPEPEADPVTEPVAENGPEPPQAIDRPTVRPQPSRPVPPPDTITTRVRRSRTALRRLLG